MYRPVSHPCRDVLPRQKQSPQLRYAMTGESLSPFMTISSAPVTFVDRVLGFLDDYAKPPALTLPPERAH